MVNGYWSDSGLIPWKITIYSMVMQQEPKKLELLYMYVYMQMMSKNGVN